MNTSKFKDILDDAAAKLSKVENVTDIEFTHVIDRYFSAIYEITANKESKKKNYILKISTTERSSQFEYDQYVYLQEKRVRSLIPIYFSEELNYLITRKENLKQFDTYLKALPSQALREKSFFKLGEFFKDMDSKTGSTVTFNKGEVDAFAIPRIDSLSKLPNGLRQDCVTTFEAATTRKNGEPIALCFTSDFTLGNIHLDSDNEFVLLDLGDSDTRDRYWNISYIRLNSLYGPLNQYFTKSSRDDRYFDSFIQGYGLEKIDNISLNLYEIIHLTMMISFISNLASTSSNPLRVLASQGSNWYLNHRYITRLRKVIRILKSELS